MLNVEFIISIRVLYANTNRYGVILIDAVHFNVILIVIDTVHFNLVSEQIFI